VAVLSPAEDPSVAAAVPSPGLFGATAAPALTAAPVRALTDGTQPSALPGMLRPPEAVKALACPETVQPVEEALVSDTLTGASDPLADDPWPETVNLTGVDPTVSENEPRPVAGGIVTVTDSVPEPSRGCAGLTVYDTAADVEALNAVALAGVNVAVSECAPSASVVVVVATPEEPTVAVPRSFVPSLKSTDPADTAVPEAAFTAADSVSADRPASRRSLR
jgi:hypothetical protein